MTDLVKRAEDLAKDWSCCADWPVLYAAFLRFGAECLEWMQHQWPSTITNETRRLRSAADAKEAR